MWATKPWQLKRPGPIALLWPSFAGPSPRRRLGSGFVISGPRLICLSNAAPGPRICGAFLWVGAALCPNCDRGQNACPSRCPYGGRSVWLGLLGGAQFAGALGRSWLGLVENTLTLNKAPRVRIRPFSIRIWPGSRPIPTLKFQGCSRISATDPRPTATQAR